MLEKSFQLSLNHESAIPKYLQLINGVNEAIAKNILHKGDMLPSVNSVCYDLHLSRDTVFKAYNMLKKQGVIESVPKKGYFVTNETRKVLLLLDTFKAYKEVLYHAFVKNVPDNVIVDVQFHHYHIGNFKTIINNSMWKYYRYIIMPFDNDEVPISLAKISNNELLLIDWNVHASSMNNFVFQDFGKAFFSALDTAIERFRNYKKLVFIYPIFTDHPVETIKYFKEFCLKNKFHYQIIKDTETFSLKKGEAYISVSDRILGNFLEQCWKRGIEPGKDVGFLSYNETPMKKFIYKGIAVISTDFEELGRKAAEFVSTGKKIQHYVPTKVILRDSL